MVDSQPLRFVKFDMLESVSMERREENLRRRLTEPIFGANVGGHGHCLGGMERQRCSPSSLVRRANSLLSSTLRQVMNHGRDKIYS